VSWLSDRLAEVAAAVGLDSAAVEALVDGAASRADAIVRASVTAAAQAVADVVAEAIVDAIPGQTFTEIAQAVADAASVALAEPPARATVDADTVVSAEVAAGEHEERAATQPEALFTFEARVDERTSEVCRACDGTTLPGSHPWWLTHLPPLHPNCRSRIVPASGGSVTAAPDVDAGPFGDVANPWVPT
jgi:SPP1 gp7 family putative phage head morphogenesis protein